MYEKKIIQLYGDSARFDFRDFYDLLDFVFVDGAHSYEYAKFDSETAFKLIDSRGFILWHDYGSWPRVITALEELYNKGLDLRHS